MGFKLSPNFNRPFSAQSIAAFWSRWHISLTTWLRDYVYFSLPSKYQGKTVQWLLNLNLLITFVLVGFWHGPYWNFIIFGFLHGTYMVLANTFRPVMTNFNLITGLNGSPRLLKWLNIAATFLLVSSTGFFFGQHPVSDSFMMMENLRDFSHTGTSLMELLKNLDFLLGVFLIFFMLGFEYLVAVRDFASKFMQKSIVIRYAAYLFMVFFILVFGVFSSQKFFYFQF
jgi:D-alanyl-lipoteichoic acid acyltransferase DltB (MBOAT superfamily)